MGATRRAMSGEERLWKVWWLWGVPVAALATALTLSAEFLRMDGLHSWGEFLDAVKLLVYAAWLTAAWRCAEKAERPAVRIAARLAVAAGVLTAALTV